MMNRDALEYVVGQSAAELDQLAKTDTPVACLPESMAIRSLEKFMFSRSRFRGIFDTTAIHEFAEYNNKEALEGTTCFIDAERMSAETIFDIGTTGEPGHCEHRARLKLEKTADYLAILSIVNKKLSQQELAEWMEDWRSFLCVKNPGGDDIETKKAIAAIRNITIKASASVSSTTESFSSKKSAMEQIDAKAKDAEPAYLYFTCIPYTGLKARTFEMRLSIITGETPRLTLRIVRHEQAVEEMSEELKTLLIEQLKGDQVTTYLGSFSS